MIFQEDIQNNFKQTFFLPCAGNLECWNSLCVTDQETQEEIILWASSYTYLLYKAQDPFST